MNHYALNLSSSEMPYDQAEMERNAKLSSRRGSHWQTDNTLGCEGDRSHGKAASDDDSGGIVVDSTLSEDGADEVRRVPDRGTGADGPEHIGRLCAIDELE